MHSSFIYLKLILTAVVWGGTFVAGRVLAHQVGPFSAAFLRFLVASMFLVLFVLKSHGAIPLLKKGQILPTLLLALTGVFSYNFCFFSGLQSITASRASLIIATNPVFIALLASILFREKLNLLQGLGILLSLSGALTVISHGQPLAIWSGGLGRGELYIFGCVFSWVAYSLIGKIVMRELSPLLSVTYACSLGAFLLFPPAYLEGITQQVFHYSATVWISLGYLGLFGSALGFIWYYQGIVAIGPSRAGVFINIVPVSSILLAYLLLQEAVDTSLMVGALLVISGVTLTNRSARAPANCRNNA
jgi:drug/metabolite transporter (DMT)-like permease